MGLASVPLLRWNYRRQRTRNGIPTTPPLLLLLRIEKEMEKPNHRILVVDDNPSIHEDFRKILCPSRPDRTEMQSLKAALFERATPPESSTDFEFASAFQGQEALELVKRASDEG